MADDDQNRSLKRKTWSGTFWVLLEQVGTKGLGFIIQLYLARVLGPREFGLIAMVIVFISIGNAIIDSGMTQSLIRLKSISHIDYSTVFISNLASSILIYLVVFAVAPYVSLFYNHPELTRILRVLALIIPVKSLIAIQYARLVVLMNFRKQALIQLVSVCLAGTLATYLAINEFGVWSLVAMHVSNAVFITILYWTISLWFPRLSFSYSVLKTHFSFGYKLMLSTILNAFFKDVYNIVIGKAYSTTLLGFYNRASVIQKLPPLILGRAINRVTYPLFVQMKDEEDKLRSSIKSINKVVAFGYLPGMMFLLINAKALVLFLLTDKWVEMVPFLQILVGGSLLLPIQYYNTNIAQTYGRTGLILRFNIVSRSITLAAIVILLNFNIYYLVAFEALNMTITSLLFAEIFGRLIKYGVCKQLQDILPEILLSTFCGIIVYTLSNLITGSNLTSLGLSAAIYLTLYLGAAHLIRMSSLRKINKEIRIRLNRRP